MQQQRPPGPSYQPYQPPPPAYVTGRAMKRGRAGPVLLITVPACVLGPLAVLLWVAGLPAGVPVFLAAVAAVSMAAGAVWAFRRRG